MIRYVAVIPIMLIVPTIFMTIPSARNVPAGPEGELGYRLVPSEVVKQIETRGPRPVLWELFNRADEWDYVIDEISSGQREWIHVAARLYPVSDVAASIELDHALWSALENSPTIVLEAAGADLPLRRVCSEVASTPLDCPFDEAMAGVERRLKALAAVTRDDLKDKRKKCESLLRETLPRIKEEHVSALVRTAEFGGEDVVRFILAGGVAPNSRTRDGTTALMRAVSKGRLDNVKLLVGKGANVNERGAIGWTPLMEASSQGHTETVKFLLEKGAAINAKAADGSRALDIAVANNRREVADVLRKHEASSRGE